MFERGEPSQVSALWNLAYDAGMGAGALGFGHTGYPAGFVLVAALITVTLPLTRVRPACAPLPR
ncbi:hypothetical protein [Nonomuraea basaltis]|uniref:hypothetical protein n=1 Tax=Nonomuraea basaltis TaxID=2495887 RepID=UPI0019806F54|nr:hypothetical protein [Nonomuraea basaltis]